MVRNYTFVINDVYIIEKYGKNGRGIGVAFVLSRSMEHCLIGEYGLVEEARLI
ncbi:MULTISPECIES: hypothetical protein [Mannheimia]|uniref:Uncharacterized protein n=1 Tax=Mannheimia pernigra TaxID=111844 RepID=A0A7H8UTV3_9PAST|nr:MULTISPECIES: hypothetical protein [Mannheimia]QLB40203.1 hypothetical protein HV559_04620 [Mannheimia pernigra]QLB44082.1 hypothetical protein HV561_04630 [Mannheimia pernigra]QTM00573.1 hypothetical protein GM698_02510 [Mannheimia sp. ZY171111]